jgi:membrane associated rhomboid family serine protease
MIEEENCFKEPELPLTDRDYMKNPSPPPRRRTIVNFTNSSLNPLWALIAINLFIFLITSFSDSAFNKLALAPGLLTERPWTLLTAMFVHYNIWHIVFNMIALYFFGRMLISLVGPNRFLLVYFVGGIIGNGLFMLLNLHSYSQVVGASGAVYAIAGALVVMVPNIQIALWGIIPMRLWVFVIVFMVLLSVPPFAGTDIAWQAHVGGLATGLVFGLVFRRGMRWVF